MNLDTFSDKIVFNILKDIEYGYLEILTYQGRLIKFGNKEETLKAKIKIKKPNFTFNLIKGGSIGFAESYMRDEFDTDDLSNLIERILQKSEYLKKQKNGSVRDELVNFMNERFRSYILDHEYDLRIYNAIRDDGHFVNYYMTLSRIRILSQFMKTNNGISLLKALKRINNILTICSFFIIFLNFSIFFIHKLK